MNSGATLECRAVGHCDRLEEIGLGPGVRKGEITPQDFAGYWTKSRGVLKLSG